MERRSICMNERTDTLWENSTGALMPSDGFQYMATNYELRKFAESIVQECINIIHQQDRIPKEFFYAKDAHTHEYAIKKHFGMIE